MPPYILVTSIGDAALTILDVADPTAPVFAGGIQGAGPPNFLDAAEDVFVVGNYAYVTAYTDCSLSIFDISDPTAPVLLGSIQGFGPPNFLGGPHRMFVQGNYAYVAAADDNSLTIIDVSNPAAPVFVGNIQGLGAPNFLGSIRGVFILGNYVYVAAEEGALTIIDVSNPAAPAFVGSIQGIGAPNFLGLARAVFVSGDYAYVAAADDNSLTIIDVSDPAHPAFVGHIDGIGAPNFLGTVINVFVVVTLAYVVAENDNSMTIIDVSNPAAPAFVGSIQGMGAPNFLSGANGVYYIVGALPPVLPTVETDAASAVTENSGTPNGTLTDDGGAACDCGFEWGDSIAYGHTTPTVSKTTGETFSQVLAGLDPNKTYHFRAFATNPAGTSYGADRTFTTSVAMPAVTTDPETTVSSMATTFNGTLNTDGGESCECGYEWGKTVSYGSVTPIQSKTTGQSFAETIAPLDPDTEYHFRAYARNAAGTVYGADRSFRTYPAMSQGYALGRREL